MACEPDQHWWTQDGPYDVYCDECDAAGRITITDPGVEEPDDDE